MIHERYEEIVQGFAGKRLVVLGDLMLDGYIWGRATRISPESPVMVVEVDSESSVPGGAANVVNNLLALGARVAVVGVVGDDAPGRELVAGLRERGANVDGIVADSSRPTTRKTRVVAHNQQLLRIDREQTHPIGEQSSRSVIDTLSKALDTADGLIVSDYNKGVLTQQVARCAINLASERNILLTSNPKPANVRSLVGAQVVQLNQSEAEAVAGALPGEDDRERDRAGIQLARELQIENLLVTRGSKGLTVWTSGGAAHHIPPHPVEVYDVAGAGDTVISALTLAILAGARIEEAADVANHAAACAVRKLGVATVTMDEILDDWRETRA